MEKGRGGAGFWHAPLFWQKKGKHMWFLLCPSGAAGMGVDGTRRNEKIHRIQRNDSQESGPFSE